MVLSSSLATYRNFPRGSKTIAAGCDPAAKGLPVIPPPGTPGAVSAAASVLGGIAGWYIGFGLWWSVSEFFFTYVPGFSHENFDRVRQLYSDNAFWAIFAAAFTPIPYKVFTIGAGVFSVSLQTLIAASVLGRSGRFFLVATAIFFFGARAKAVIERHFEWMTLLLCALIIAGFLAIRLLF